MIPLADAWERVEAQVHKRAYAYMVCVAPALPPVLPNRARVNVTYIPPGKKRHRTVRFEGEGLTLAEALNALADDLAVSK